MPSLERDVNAWLEKSSVKVVNIIGNMAPQSGNVEGPGEGYLSGSPYAPSDVFLVVVYQK